MASNYTTNYQLNQWEAGDQVLRTEFNRDNQKIDGALAANAEAIAAEVAARTALTETVSGKGNCQVWTTSYTGTGTVNEEGACHLTFPKPPALFIIGNPFAHGICVSQGVLVRVSGNDRQSTTWSSDGLSVSWHNSNAAMQFNEEGEIYRVVAFLPMEE